MTNLRRSAIKRLLRGLSKSPKVARLSAAGLNLFGYYPHSIDTCKMQHNKLLAPVFEASRSEVASPRKLGEKAEILQHSLPPICPYLIEDVLVKSSSSIFRKNHSALLPQNVYNARDRIRLEHEYDTSVTFDNILFLQQETTLTLQEGICAFGQGDANWYHWLAEILPAVLLSQNLPPAYADYPLLIPEVALKIPTFKDTLNLCRGNRDVVVLKDEQLYQVKKLIHIPPPVSGPFNMYDHHWPEPEDYIQNAGVMRFLRTVILEKLGIERDNSSPKLIFLARPENARSFNQSDIIAAAQERGFEPVRMEKLSFREQVHLMHNADCVVGPTGAAFANTLFMRPDSCSLVWALDKYRGGCFFSNLAHISGSHMTYCFVEADGPVNNTYEAFGASYTLSVQEFCHNLDEILAQSYGDGPGT